MASSLKIGPPWGIRGCPRPAHLPGRARAVKVTTPQKLSRTQRLLRGLESGTWNRRGALCGPLRAAGAALQRDSDDKSGAEGEEQQPDGSESAESIGHAAHLTAGAGKVRKGGRPCGPNLKLLKEKRQLLQELGVPEAVIEELGKRKALLNCSAEMLRGAVEWLLLKGLSEKGLVKAISMRLPVDLLQANEDLLRKHGLSDSEILTILEAGSFSNNRSLLQDVDAIVQLLAQELTQKELVKVLVKGRVLCQKFQNLKGSFEWFKRQNFQNLGHILARWPRLLGDQRPAARAQDAGPGASAGER